MREGGGTEDAAGATRTRILIVVCVGVCVSVKGERRVSADSFSVWPSDTFPHS